VEKPNSRHGILQPWKDQRANRKDRSILGPVGGGGEKLSFHKPDDKEKMKTQRSGTARNHNGREHFRGVNRDFKTAKAGACILSQGTPVLDSGKVGLTSIGSIYRGRVWQGGFGGNHSFICKKGREVRESWGEGLGKAATLKML